MKAFALALVALVSLSATAWAHNGAEHMRGTVTEITDKTITVQMPNKTTMTVRFAADTKFDRNGKPAAATDVKAGDRVVIDYVTKDKQMIAKGVKIGSAATPATSTPKHPKG